MDSSSTPVLQNGAGLRKGKIGFPTSVQATLYAGRIEVEKNGEVVVKAPLNQITSARIQTSVVSFKLANGQYFSLDFQSTARRAGFAAFGGVGALVGAYTGQGRKIAQQWAMSLESSGVKFR